MYISLIYTVIPAKKPFEKKQDPKKFFIKK